MKLISNQIRILQVLNLSIYGILSLSLFFFWIENKSMTNLSILLLTLVVVGLANLFYLKLFEVYLDDKEIVLKNLLTTRTIARKDFIKIERTILSPLIFKINLDKENVYFMIDISDTINGILDRDFVAKRINDEFK